MKPVDLKDFTRTAALTALAAVLFAGLAGCAAGASPSTPQVAAPAQTEMPVAATEAVAATASVANPTPGAPQAGQAYPVSTALPQPTPYPGAATAAPDVPAAYPGPASDPGPVDAPADELPAEAAARLTLSGGIAGKAETWLIYRDGRVVAGSGLDAPLEPAGEVAPERVTALIDELDRLGFFELDSSYGPRDACCDLITVTLEARTAGGQVQRVTFLQGQQDTPSGLLAALQAVQAMIADVKQ